MDTELEVKEEDPLSDDVASQNKTEIFTMNVTMVANSDAVFLYDNCDIGIKTEIKSETALPGVCSQKAKKEHSRIDIETEIEKRILVSQNKGKFPPQDSVMSVQKHSCYHEVYIKEECWLETENSSFCDEIKDMDLNPVKSPRVCTEAVAVDIGKLPLPSAEDSCERQGEADVPCIGEPVDPEQSDEFCDKGNVCARNLYLKQGHFNNEGKNQQKCKICERSFTRLSDLKRHYCIHEGKSIHKCETCEKSFSFLSSLKRHILIHEGKRRYKCEICGKRFTQLSSLKNHNLIHEGKKPYKCKICERRFTQLSHLNNHNLVHEGKKPYKCKICEKGFSSLAYLKSHYLIHEGKKPHKCVICEKKFTQFSHLKSHSLIHEGKKPHKCETCEKRFRVLSSLKRHKLTHNGEKLHWCEICEKRFSFLSSLKRHNVVHKGIKPHSCKICNKNFSVLSSLKRHILIHQRHNAPKV